MALRKPASRFPALGVEVLPSYAGRATTGLVTCHFAYYAPHDEQIAPVRRAEIALINLREVDTPPK